MFIASMLASLSLMVLPMSQLHGLAESSGLSEFQCQVNGTCNTDVKLLTDSLNIPPGIPGAISVELQNRLGNGVGITGIQLFIKFEPSDMIVSRLNLNVGSENARGPLYGWNTSLTQIDEPSSTIIILAEVGDQGVPITGAEVSIGAIDFMIANAASSPVYVRPITPWRNSHVLLDAKILATDASGTTANILNVDSLNTLVLNSSGPKQYRSILRKIRSRQNVDLVEFDWDFDGVVSLVDFVSF